VAALAADVADDYRTRRARGEDPSPDEYVARHPEAAEAIRGVLAALRLAASSVARPPGPPPADPAPPTGRLGDFRIIREVGRGGMGVVYEAEQISLGRRVALKVLPFAALSDPRLLQRFKNEARAAAALDHPHVVKVHAVGEDRAVHFIAMQFIDGRPLSDLIRAVHGPDPTGPAPDGPLPATGSVAALISKATGVDPYYVGKPNPLMMRSALNAIEAHSESTAMIGDRMDTDVVSGLEAGLHTILVLSGVATREAAERFPYRASRIVDSVADLVDEVR